MFKQMDTKITLFSIFLLNWTNAPDICIFDLEVEDQVQEKKSVVTSRQTTIEMAIPHKAVGAIIGRQGQNIKEVILS